MFREVAEKSEGVMFCGGKKVWLPDCLLLRRKRRKESFVSGEA